MRRRGLGMLALVPVLALAVFAGGGCGNEASEGNDPETGVGRWRHATIAGLTEASGVAVFDGHLLVVSGGDRRTLSAVSLEALAKGGDVAAFDIPLKLDREAYLGGAERFSGQGYQVGDLWDQPLEFCGVATLGPDQVFLADAVYRVVYAGRMERGPEGRLTALRIHRACVIPGGRREAADASDWRDKGSLITGLASTQGSRETADLIAIGAETDREGAARIHKFDKFGMPLGTFLVRVPSAADAGAVDVGGVAFDGARLLLVRGTGRGLLHPFRDVGWEESVNAGPGVPGPEVAEAGPWRGLVTGPDGTLYLVSGGATTVVAWRSP